MDTQDTCPESPVPEEVSVTPENQRGAVLLLAVTFIVVGLFCAYRFADWMAWRRGERSAFTAISHVTLFWRVDHADASGQMRRLGGFKQALIKDADTITELWAAMGYFRMEEAPHITEEERAAGKNPCVALISYPVASESEDEPLEFPIFIYKDGRSAWGAPEAPHWYHTPELRDTVLEIAKTVGLPDNATQ